MAPWGQTLRKEMHKATTVFHLVMNRFHSIIKKRGEKRKKNYKKKILSEGCKTDLMSFPPAFTHFPHASSGKL